MFNSETILIGHSLDSDFKALKLIHDIVVDTSVLYPHKMGPPKKRALKTLCIENLKKIIQESGRFFCRNDHPVRKFNVLFPLQIMATTVRRIRSFAFSWSSIIWGTVLFELLRIQPGQFWKYSHHVLLTVIIMIYLLRISLLFSHHVPCLVMEMVYTHSGWNYLKLNI